MADKIKKFFKKKKLDAKFKKLGEGRKLDTVSTSSSLSQTSSDYNPPQRSGLTHESKQAATAALARLQGQQRTDASFNTSLSAIQAQVRREIEAEKKKPASNSPQAESSKLESVETDATPLLAVQGVYFKCPNISPEVLSKDEWNQKIREFLYEQLSDEKGLTSCLMLVTLNKNKEKVETCIETILKYLENIVQNPSEEKFRKIRQSNRIYKEKVEPLEGARLVLEAAGFEPMNLPFNDQDEEFLVFAKDSLEDVEVIVDALRSVEPIQLELDRNLQVLLPSQARLRNELPPVFYHISPEELKKEQALRAEQIDKNLMLRTKVMREKEEMREMKKYRFALIRVRFPDGIMIQGTFGVYEKFPAVVEFIRECLIDENLEFNLTSPTSQHLTDKDEGSLMELRLVPATILNLTASGERNKEMLLKPEVVVLARPRKKSAAGSRKSGKYLKPKSKTSQLRS